jgi:hypothetical protein
MPSDSEIEIRSFCEAADFGEAFAPELQESEARLRQQIEASQGKERR